MNISTPEQALVEVETLVNLKQPHYVCFFEGNLFARALRERDVHDVISQAALIYPDGIIISKEMKWKLKKKVSRVSGPSFLLNTCEYGLKQHWRHFFIGGADGVAERLVCNLRERFPGIQIAGFYTPPFRELTEEEELQIKNTIEDNHADLLWVGLGGPKQEFWMKNHLGKINVPVMLGIGAAFDFHSGNRSWAPPFIREIGLEWLYRLLTNWNKMFIRVFKAIYVLLPVLIIDYIKSFVCRPQLRKTHRP